MFVVVLAIGIVGRQVPASLFDFGQQRWVIMRHRSVVIVPRHRRDGRVEIRSDHSLVVDGREVAVDASARELTGAYYDLVDSIYREAKRIGGEGAKVGVQGAKVGLRAVAGVFRMVLPDYDSNDLERDIEKEKIKLEDRAQRLEARAERLEDKVHELEGLHDDLKDSVPELGELEWF